MGLPVSAVSKVNARISVPTTIISGDVNGTTVVPVMVGLGAGYLLQPRMALVGFHTMVGVAWKLSLSSGRGSLATRCSLFPRS